MRSFAWPAGNLFVSEEHSGKLFPWELWILLSFKDRYAALTLLRAAWGKFLWDLTEILVKSVQLKNFYSNFREGR